MAAFRRGPPTANRGKRIAIGLGGYPDVTLAEARETASANRRKVCQGEDPRKRKPVATRQTTASKSYPTSRRLRRRELVDTWGSSSGLISANWHHLTRTRRKAAARRAFPCLLD